MVVSSVISVDEECYLIKRRRESNETQREKMIVRITVIFTVDPFVPVLIVPILSQIVPQTPNEYL